MKIELPAFRVEHGQGDRTGPRRLPVLRSMVLEDCAGCGYVVLSGDTVCAGCWERGRTVQKAHVAPRTVGVRLSLSLI